MALGHREIVQLDGGHNQGRTGAEPATEQPCTPMPWAKHIKIMPGEYTEEAGITAAPEILNSTMTAVFIGNDESAVGLAGAALRAGVAIPEQLSIVGYDDSPAARTFACVSPPSNKMPRTYPALPSTQS